MLKKSFDITRREKIEVLDGLTLNVSDGEFIAIMGPSGSGKSTFLNILASIEDPTDGFISIDGENLSKTSEKNLIKTRRHKTSIIYQDFNLLAYITALENVMVPMVLAGRKEEEARKNAMELLQKVHLEHRANHEPDDLSGGEQQRVAIARALANNPKILLADEPTGNLDSKTGDEIVELFREIITEKGITILVVTHDLQIAAKTDRILILRDGKLFREEEITEVQ